MPDTQLEKVPGWSEDQVARMKKSWITTAEQVVALSATEGGLRSVSEQLKISEQEARRLVDSARLTLDPAVRAEMETPVDTSQYGLGVLPPRKGQEKN